MCFGVLKCNVFWRFEVCCVWRLKCAEVFGFEVSCKWFGLFKCAVMRQMSSVHSDKTCVSVKLGRTKIGYPAMSDDF